VDGETGKEPLSEGKIGAQVFTVKENVIKWGIMPQLKVLHNINY